jgi:hypothetical protein
MPKQMLWEAGVVITLLGGVTSGCAQKKPSPPREAAGLPAARGAAEDTPKDNVAKPKMAKLEALPKKLESIEHKNQVKNRRTDRADVPGTTRASQTCLICRLMRVDTTSLQRTTTKYEENECSRWYAANVEPHHKHVWEASTCVFISGPDGRSSSVACNPGRYPIWLLSPETQLTVYQHFKNPIDARELFLGLADAKTHNDRLEHDQDKGHLIVDEAFM